MTDELKKGGGMGNYNRPSKNFRNRSNPHLGAPRSQSGSGRRGRTDYRSPQVRQRRTPSALGFFGTPPRSKRKRR